MTIDETGVPKKSVGGVVASVLLFWVGYAVLSLLVGFLTSMGIQSKVWQLTAWGYISSLGLIALAIKMGGWKGSDWRADYVPSLSSWKRLAVGLLVGAGAFGVHFAVIASVGGPIQFQLRSEVGAAIVLMYFARLMSTSCREESGFRGHVLKRLLGAIGLWPAVVFTAIAFGLSHLLYGWELKTIFMGVVPFGMVWGMAAVATRGLAVPIGLHAAWNFAGWTVGARAEAGLFELVIDDTNLERTQSVGTFSYLAVCALLTVAFWYLHRRSEGQGAKSHTSS
ncbi:MAG: type II CAAX endopeptidase family protein [Planctomycetota bacterium]|nr:type II CAAX endopeptidase family protein [Planctomycetota bacterium]